MNSSGALTLSQLKGPLSPSASQLQSKVQLNTATLSSVLTFCRLDLPNSKKQLTIQTEEFQSESNGEQDYDAIEMESINQINLESVSLSGQQSGLEKFQVRQNFAIGLLEKKKEPIYWG